MNFQAKAFTPGGRRATYFAAACLLCACAAAGGEDACAGEFEDAQKRLNQAYVEYYQALKRSPDPSKDAARLSKRILEPAQSAVSRAISNQTRNTMQQLKTKKRPPVAPLEGEASVDPKTSPWYKDGGNATGEKGPAPAAVTHAGDTGGGERPNGAASGPGLDGSKVPKELEFRNDAGSKKKAAP